MPALRGEICRQWQKTDTKKFRVQEICKILDITICNVSLEKGKSETFKIQSIFSSVKGSLNTMIF